MHKEKLRKRYLTYSVPKLKKLADAVVSEYIRKRDKGICITCGNQKEWKYQQAGHYVSRVYSSLRYYEKNLNCQCYSCNVMKKGNMDEYAIKLIEKYGTNILEELKMWKHKPTTTFKPRDIVDIIETFKEKLEGLTETHKSVY